MNDIAAVINIRQSVFKDFFFRYNYPSDDHFNRAYSDSVKDDAIEMNINEFMKWLMSHDQFWRLNGVIERRPPHYVHTIEYTHIVEKEISFVDLFLSSYMINVKVDDVIYSVFEIKHPKALEIKKDIEKGLEDNERAVIIDNKVFYVFTNHFERDYNWLNFIINNNPTKTVRSSPRPVKQPKLEIPDDIFVLYRYEEPHTDYNFNPNIIPTKRSFPYGYIDWSSSYNALIPLKENIDQFHKKLNQLSMMVGNFSHWQTLTRAEFTALRSSYYSDIKCLRTEKTK